jgi:predicted DNA-binding protein YlxM (UPF0122 family)
MENSKQVNCKNSDLFDQYLIEFQEDIKRIVGKFKKSFHALSDEEIYSECNLHLLKNKEKILNSFPSDQDFNQSEFKKIAYHYVKNEAVWAHYRFTNKSYNRRKLDGYTETEDGTKTVFEAAIETQGEENKELDNDEIYFQSNSKQFFHVLTKYCYLLTEKECKLLSFYQKGLSQVKISEELEVTHQAISTMFLGIQEKLNHFFDAKEVLQGGNSNDISKGKQSMNSFFDQGLDNPVIHSSDKKKIKKFILKNPRTYSGQEINKILFNNKYSMPKISGAIRSLKLTPLVTSINRPFTEAQKLLMLKLFKKGNSILSVSKKIGAPLNSCQRMRGEFVKKGLLTPLRKSKS